MHLLDTIRQSEAWAAYTTEWRMVSSPRASRFGEALEGSMDATPGSKRSMSSLAVFAVTDAPRANPTSTQKGAESTNAPLARLERPQKPCKAYGRLVPG